MLRAKAAHAGFGWVALRRIAAWTRGSEALVLMFGVLVVILLLGPAQDERNRVAGIVSTVLSLSGVAAISRLSAASRRVLAASLTVVGIAAAAFAYTMVQPEALGPIELKGWWPSAIAQAWPHFDYATVNAIGGTFGLAEAEMPPSTVGFLTLPASFVAGSLALTSRSRRARSAWIAASLLAAVFVLGSASRTEMVALIVGVAALVVAKTLGPRHVFALLAAAFSVIVVGSIGWFWWDGRLNARVGVWATALNDLAASPVLGPGYGSFPYRHPQLFNAHNTYLQLLVDLGAVGFASIAVATWASLRRAGDILAQRPRDRDDELLGLITVSSCAGLAVAGLADSVVTMPLHASRGWTTILVPELPLILAAPLWLRERLRSRLECVERDAVPYDPAIPGDGPQHLG